MAGKIGFLHRINRIDVNLGAPMSRPLWKILLKLSQMPSEAHLTCDECYVILDYLADAAAHATTQDQLYQMARQHLARCPGCREQYLARLRELERKLDARSPKHKRAG